MISFEFDFRSRAPQPPLHEVVESIWYARGRVPYRSERIAPTGSTVAVLVLGDPIIETAQGREPLQSDSGFLIGPHDGPVHNQPTGETFAVGIVTTPVGCAPVFGLAPRTLRRRVVDVRECWPRAVALRAELLDTDGPEEMLQLVETWLHTEVSPSTPDLVRRAVALVELDPVRSIGEIARELGVSHSHLDRAFGRIVGLSPRVLARLLRMRRLLAAIEVDVDHDWAATAASLGWYDQAHLIRDFKRHTGVTPLAYLAAQRAFASNVAGVDTAGFVPDGDGYE
ncbi:MAG: helix-turn-helix domain-containing protein [Acidimicrobiia bacterium]